jgi:hypothetical protein
MKEKTLSLVIVSAMVLLNLALISCAKAPLSKSEKDQQQDSVRDLANKTLSDLYTKNPAAKDAIAAAAGYAVFSDFGFKVIFLGGALAGAVTVSKGVKMFQLNDEGAIVGVSLTAAKYYRDEELN